MNYNSKIRGSLIGGAIGDALGYQIEFKKNVKEKEVTRFNNGIGIISDDTQMTLFTANALLYRQTIKLTRGIDLNIVDTIYLAYKDWLDTQRLDKTNTSISWIKNIKELNALRAPGNTCLDALYSSVRGSIKKPINDSKGCGTVMRIAPIGLYIKDCHEAGVIAAESSALTHGHQLGIIPSYVLASMINLITYNNLEIIDALNISMKNLHKKYNIFDRKNIKYFEKLVEKAVTLSKSDMSDQEAIYELGYGWVAEEAFAIALYSCLKHSNSFEDTVVCAINHDGDSDSTGAVAGNIIGAHLGIDSIPNYYLDNVEIKDIILEIADDLSRDLTNNPITEDNYWLSKYLYCNYTKKE